MGSTAVGRGRGEPRGGRTGPGGVGPGGVGGGARGAYHQPVGGVVQGPAEVLGGLEAVRAGLLQGREHHLVQGLGDLGAVGAGRFGALRQVLTGHLHAGGPVEGRAPGEHLVQHHAHGVQVRARVHDGAAGLLGGDVPGGAHDRVGLGQRGRRLREGAGDPEVHDLDAGGPPEGLILLVPLQHHDVGRLDVPVDHPVFVAVGQRVQDVLGVADGVVQAQLALLGQQLLQRRAVQALHDDVRDLLGAVSGVQGDGRVALQLGAQRRHGRGGLRVPILPGVLVQRDERTGVVHGDDARVVQGGHGLRLPLEAGAEGRVLGVLGAQHLDGHLPAQARVLGGVHGGHPAGADDVVQLVAGIENAGNALVHGCIIRRCPGRPARWGSRSGRPRVRWSAARSPNPDPSRRSPGRRSRWRRTRPRSNPPPRCCPPTGWCG